MNQLPSDPTPFLEKALQALKEISSSTRWIVFILLIAAAILLTNKVIPDNFVQMTYFAIGVGAFVYVVVEIKQSLDHRANQQQKIKELQLKHEEEERKREHERKLAGNGQKVEEPAPAPDPQDAMRHYLTWLVSQVETIPLTGVDKKAADQEQDDKLRLDRVYTALLTTATAQDKQSPERQDKAKLISALAQLNAHHRLVLLGDPGSGKSTFVNFAALCLANEGLGKQDSGLTQLTAPLPDDEGKDEKERQPWQHGALIPLRIILRDFAIHGLPPLGSNESINENHLWTFVQGMLPDNLKHCATVLQKMFAAGDGLLLLDGLDEVEEANQRRAQIKQLVKAFSTAYPASRIVVTSRTYAYKQQDWALDKFQDAQLTPFSQGQIIRFIIGWYRYTASRLEKELDWADYRAAQLWEAIFSQPQLRELAQRPLLLTLMASLHAWRSGELPRQRQQLYEETVDLLLERWETRQKGWDGQREVTQPSIAEWLRTDRYKVRQLLNKLAYEAHEAETANKDDARKAPVAKKNGNEERTTADIPQKALLDGLLELNNNPDAQPRQLESYLRDRAGLLTARAEGVYTFPHRTFQEYLAACYLVVDDVGGYPDHLAELVRSDPNKWREVLLLGGAKKGPTDVWTIVEALCFEDAPEHLTWEKDWQDLWGAQLAGQLLAEVLDPEAHLSKTNERRMARLKGWLLHALTTPYLEPRERALAGRTLGLFGDPRADVSSMVPTIIEIPAGPFLMGSDKAKDQGAYGDETPQHEVRLPRYGLGKYPVTNAQFRYFVEAGGYQTRQYWTDGGWKQCQEEKWTAPRYWQESRFNGANQPVVGISWYEAVAYCAWLRQETGRLFRLPSEAMWEKGARGEKGQLYPWGDEWDEDKLNHSESNINAPSTVGIFPAGQSPYGIHDSSGNVLEWCSSLWDSYPFTVQSYTKELLQKGTRSRRGGAFNYYQRSCRSAFRYLDYPGSRDDGLGFRVAEHLSDTDF